MTSVTVMIGPAGVGKGTQAKILEVLAGWIHISSGDLFRDNIREQTELGKAAQVYTAKGELVPIEITVKMIQARISLPDCEAGIMLDGYPRTKAQAIALTEMLANMGLKVNSAISFLGNIPDMVTRIVNRLNCRNCQNIFSRLDSLTEESPCPVCAEQKLYQRDDDKEEQAKKRLEIFQAEATPILEYYQAQGVLFSVDGSLSIPLVTAHLRKGLWQVLPVIETPVPLSVE